MMKRITLLILSAVLFFSAKAEDATTVYVLCTDGTAQSYEIESIAHITFDADASHLFLNTTDGIKVTYPVSFVDCIQFEEPDKVELQSYVTDFDVAIDPSDDTSYSFIKEKVTTVETATNDYGDFIENFIDDEEAKGTVTVTYSGMTASFTYNPTSLKNTVVVVASGRSSDVVAYAMKKVRFILTGSTTDGSFKLYAAKKSRITLNNVSITNADGGALIFPKTTVSGTEFGGKTLYIELPAGTVNTLADGTTYAEPPAGESMKGVVFSEGQFIFSGTGTLNVNANYGHGIASDDYVRVRGGSHNPVINITTSNKDGISVNDYFLMNGGTVTVQSADDGVDVGKGYVEINAGKLIVQSVDEGITTSFEGTETGIVPDIRMNGGLVKVTTSGDKGMAIKSIGKYTQTGGIVQATVSGKGSKAIESDGDMSFAGGKAVAFAQGTPIYDATEEDMKSSACVRSKGALTISGATLQLKATGNGAKGINNGGVISMTSGDVTVVAEGGDHTESGERSRARGINGDSDIQIKGGFVRARAVDNAVHTEGSLTLDGGALHAFSAEKTSVSAVSVNHTAGWMVEKIKITP